MKYNELTDKEVEKSREKYGLLRVEEPLKVTHLLFVTLVIDGLQYC